MREGEGDGEGREKERERLFKLGMMQRRGREGKYMEKVDRNTQPSLMKIKYNKIRILKLKQNVFFLYSNRVGRIFF